MSLSDFGLIGLAVMGENLVLNIERNGYSVAVYNRTAGKTNDFLTNQAVGKNITGTFSAEELVNQVKTPRKIMIMVKAGRPVDAVIEQLKPYLDPGDLIIDGGNSFYPDTERRSKALAENNINFIGVGVSGGEEGALWGPSIMPGGQRDAYGLVESIFTDISAKVDGEPCVTYIGPRGAGHYVKMVHNGIEYGDMQLIAESYDLMRRCLGLNAAELHSVFSKWNEGVLSSFLIEITAKIFARTDTETGKPLVDLILDTAAQKGTGKWTSQDAFDLGYPIPTINSAVAARIMSSLKMERLKASEVFPAADTKYDGDRQAFIDAVGDALYASKILSYAQGMGMLRAASEEYKYDLDLAEIAKIWRGGCIIRALFLNDVSAAFKDDPGLPNLLIAPFFRAAILKREQAWRHVLKVAVEKGVPTPAMSASLAAYDSYRSGRLPANLTQAQRDFFGAHTYQRIDREGVFHTEWEG
jgi:6-phosphogluconate dehydrogenase